MSHTISSASRPGSLWGAVLLISGSCIGAGMLALPIVTSAFGFVPSVAMFVMAWLLMALSGQLLAQINLSLGYHKSLMTLAEEIFGPVGKWVTFSLFLLLFYCLSVAYFAAIGPIGQALCKNLLHVDLSCQAIQVGIALLFGSIVYLGIRPVDHWNRWLMAGFAAVYFALVVLGVQHLHPAFLSHCQWTASYSALPILVISFGYQNMIPTLASYFQGDGIRLRRAIWIGTAIPLVVYLIWQVIMLGMIPRYILEQAHAMGVDASVVLQQVVSHPAIYLMGQLFAFFAIVTSLLAQSLSLVEFLGDRLIVFGRGLPRLARVLLVFILPMLWAWWKPGILFQALDLGGGIGAVALFVLLPAAMAWKRGLLVSQTLVTSVFFFGCALMMQHLFAQMGLRL